MSIKLEKAIVTERTINFTHDSYLYTYGLIQSVALGAAAFILIDLFQNTDAFWPRLSFWLASLFALIVTSSTTARGVILTGDQYNLYDTILPIALGLLEFLLFTILQPKPNFPGLWLYWYIIFGLFALCAAALTQNRLSMASKESFDSSLEDLPATYITWLRKDRTEAGFVGIGFLIAGLIALWTFPRYDWTMPMHTLIGFATTLFMFKVIRKTEMQRSEVSNRLRNLG